MRTDVSNSSVFIEYEHHKIHEGFTFYTGEIAQSIASSGTLVYGFTTGTKKIHIRPASIVTSADKMTFQAYEGSTFTGGSALSIKNRDRNSNIVSTGAWVKAPTVTVDGTLISESYIPGATGVGGTRTGADSATSESEFILLPNTKYIIRFTNGSSSANIVSWSYIWYEF